MSKRIVPILLAILCCSCMTTSSVDRKISEWRGHTADELIAVFGSPTDDIKLGSGGRVITYRQRRCVINFTVNTNGVITASNWKGSKRKCDIISGPAPH